jgi:repressor LexA
MLTRRQHELLSFIDDRLKQTGISPSFDEMKDALRLRSKAGIHRLVTALEERGFLARRRNRARALEVLRLPENFVAGRAKFAASSANFGTGSAQFAARGSNVGARGPNFGTGSTKFAAGSAQHDAARTVSAGPGHHSQPIDVPGSIALACRGNCTGVTQVPLRGRIAAGLPVEAPHATGDHLAVPAALLPDGAQQHYALEVAGDSMSEAGILDGDMVIIRRDATIESGAIAVASVAGNATLKRIVRRGNDIVLEAANANYPTRVFPAEMVSLQGQLVALLRRY